MYRHEAPAPPDCPECKKKSATMGSSSWGHDISCCSNECGYKIAAKLRKNAASKKYNKAVAKYEKAKDKLMEEKYRGIDAMGFGDTMGR